MAVYSFHGSSNQSQRVFFWMAFEAWGCLAVKGSGDRDPQLLSCLEADVLCKSLMLSIRESFVAESLEFEAQDGAVDEMETDWPCVGRYRQV